MSKDWYYKSSEWNVICDVCGKKMKSSHARHRWDGLIVCDEDFEHRHPQDFIKVKQDKITVPFTRPRPEDVFTDVTYLDTLTCTPMGRFGEADMGTANCAQVDIPLPNDLVST
jgi:hypothetical protein